MSRFNWKWRVLTLTSMVGAACHLQGCADDKSADSVYEAQFSNLQGELTKENALRIAKMIRLDGLQGMQAEVGLYRHEDSAKNVSVNDRCKMTREKGQITDADKDHIPAQYQIEVSCEADAANQVEASTIQASVQDLDDSEWRSGMNYNYLRVFKPSNRKDIDQRRLERLSAAEDKYRLTKRSTICGSSRDICSVQFTAIIKGTHVPTSEMPTSMIKSGYVEGFQKGVVESLTGFFGIVQTNGKDLILKYQGSAFDYHDRFGPTPKSQGEILFEDAKGNRLSKRAEGWFYNSQNLDLGPE